MEYYTNRGLCYKNGNIVMSGDEITFIDGALLNDIFKIFYYQSQWHVCESGNNLKNKRATKLLEIKDDKINNAIISKKWNGIDTAYMNVGRINTNNEIISDLFGDINNSLNKIEQIIYKPNINMGIIILIFLFICIYCILIK